MTNEQPPEPETRAPDSLETALGAALFSVDPPPASITESAMVAWSFRDLDRLVAELVDDSSLVPATGVRGSATATRTLEFSCGDATIDVELAAGPSPAVVIVGVASPEIRELILWVLGQRRCPVAVDDVGMFRVEGAVGAVGGAMACFEFATADGPARTTWFRM